MDRPFSRRLAGGKANRDFDRRATLGGLFSALTGTNGSTNFKRQRDNNQGERRQCCPIKSLSTILKNSRFSDRSLIRRSSHCRPVCGHLKIARRPHKTSFPFPPLIT